MVPTEGTSSYGTPRGILKPPDERKLDARDDTAVRLEAKKHRASLAAEVAPPATPSKDEGGGDPGELPAAHARSPARRDDDDDDDDHERYNIAYAPFDGAFVVADELIDAFKNGDCLCYTGAQVFVPSL